MNPCIRVTACGIVALLSHLAPPVDAQQTYSAVQVAKLTASDASAFDEFGFFTASISSDTVVIGCSLDDNGAVNNTGAAYVFVKAGTAWIEEAKLTGFDSVANDIFGRSVAISGDTIIVGAPDGDQPGFVDAGAAYVFVRNGSIWTLQARLASPNVQTGAAFGQAVAIEGDTAVVGANLEDYCCHSSLLAAGRTYVYVRTGTAWSLEATLEQDDPTVTKSFGESVSIAGDTVLVGAPRHNLQGNPGAAFVFVRNGTVWSQQAFLQGLDTVAGDQFGRSVALYGDTALIGAQDEAIGFGGASAYVFVRSGTTWAQQAHLIADDESPDDAAGYRVALWDDTALVGAPLDDHAGSIDAGSAYVFVRSGASWSQAVRLSAADAAPGDRFGSAVAIEGNTVFVTADLDSGVALKTGSAYAFDVGLQPLSAYAEPENALTGRPGGPALVLLPQPSGIGPGDDLILDPVVVVPKILEKAVIAEALFPTSSAVNYGNLGEFESGSAPAQAAAGKFDADALDDVITADSDDDTFSLLAGNAGGGLSAPIHFGTNGNTHPIATAVADLDGDLKSDVLIAGDAGISTFLGNGAGGFSFHALAPVSLVTGFAVADVNDDGKPDVVTVSGALAQNNGTVQTGFATVLLGDGLGGFTDAGQFASGHALASVLIGKLDSDNDQDVLLVEHDFESVAPAAPATGKIKLFLGDNTGAFTPAAWPGFSKPTPTGIHPLHGTLADINGDNLLDAIYTSSDNIAYPAGTFDAVQPPLVVTVLINTGTASFTDKEIGTAYVGRGVQPIVKDIAPKPLDGKQDVVLVWYVDESAGGAAITADAALKTYVAVLLGDGNGSFTDPAPNQFFTGDDPGSGDLANVDTDTVSAGPTGPQFDLLIPNAVSNSVSVLLGDGAGGVLTTLNVPAIDSLNPASLPQGGMWSGGPHELRVAQLNADLRPDFVVSNLWNDSVFGDVRASLSLFVGNGLGGFIKSQYLPLARAGEMQIADIDLDGRQDVVITQHIGPGVSSGVAVLRGIGHGSVVASVQLVEPPPGFTLTGGLAIADITGDGRPDIVTTAVSTSSGAGAVITYANAPGGPGGFTLTPSPNDLGIAWTSVDSLILGQVDGDATTDALIGTTSGNLVVAHGVGDGTFTTLETNTAAADAGGGSMALGDINGDGKSDLVCATAGAFGQSVVNELIGAGDGTFTPQSVGGISAGGDSGARRPLLADLNGDDTTDLVLVHGAANTVSVLLNELNGFSTYGSGKPGKAGITPALTGKGYSTPGGLVQLAVSKGVGGAPALLLVGIGKNLSSFLASQLVLLPVAIGLGGTPGVAGAGSFTLPAVLPAGTRFLGFEFTFQVLIKDPAAGGTAPITISATPGLAMKIK